MEILFLNEAAPDGRSCGEKLGLVNAGVDGSDGTTVPDRPPLPGPRRFTMFRRFLSRELLHTGPPRRAAAVLLRLCLQAPPLARPLSQSSDAAAAPFGDVDSHPSQTVSYLMRSCGLSPEAAHSASQKVRLKTTDNADSVLVLLREAGCSPSQVATIVSKIPNLLRMSAPKTLNPKLECLRSAGISAPHLAELLCANPSLLRNDLKKKIAFSLEFLQRVLPCGVSVGEALKHSPHMHLRVLHENIRTLRCHGVPDAGISKLLLIQPLALARHPARLEETMVAVEAMGLEPANATFPHAVGVMAYTSKETWDRKLSIYRSLGWSEGDISSAFLKQPHLLTLSDEGIRRKMEFLVGKLGMTPAALCRNPVLLMLSLEKRIAPRCAVLKVLMDRGFRRRGEVGLVSMLKLSEKHFLKRFVVMYKEEAPEVADAHLGKVEFSGFGTPAL